MPVENEPRAITFADFTVDLRAKQLRRSDIRLKLPGQPFAVLAILLERPGEVVTREELRTRLWHEETFVDFDHSLNVAVNKLRETLCDSVEHPRFVETIPRVGYRFISPVQPNGSPPPVVAAAATAPAAQQSRSLLGRIWLVPALALGLAIVLAVMRPAPSPRLLRIARLTKSGVVHGNQKLLTDGPRLYFLERSNGHWVAEWMPASGGTPVPIALPFFADLQDITPDGSELLIREITETSSSEGWTVPVTGGAPHRLGIAGILAAAYTSDGRGVFYADGSTVSECDHEGRNNRRLMTLPGDVLGISVSPQADRLRFWVAEDSKTGMDLWESRADGSNPHRVIQDWPLPRRVSRGSWSPDGRWFAFSAPASGPGREIWLIGKPGLFQRQTAPAPLTSGPMDFTSPLFSRDGKRIFVVGATWRGELQRYDFNKREFKPYLGGLSAEDINFSPDGKSLVYVSYPDGQLWRALADGSSPVPLTVPPMRSGLAFWSPDGSKIAFEARPAPGADWNLYVIPSAGSRPELVVNSTNRAGFSWAHDGKSLIVADPGQNSPLRIMDLDHRALSAIPGTEGYLYPVLSPSGRYLSARHNDSIIALDLETHRARELATQAGDLGSTQWSRDGRYVYFNRFLGTAPAFYRVSIADLSSKRLMVLDQFSAGGSFGVSSTLAPDGSLLLMRDLGGVDIYAIDWSER
jgi:DNA-binding winged helix-turn-helix (wHTH) protein/Tol biopolymer transport system component